MFLNRIHKIESNNVSKTTNTLKNSSDEREKLAICKNMEGPEILKSGLRLVMAKMKNKKKHHHQMKL